MSFYLLCLAALPLLFFVLMHIGFKAPRIISAEGAPDQLGMKYREVEIPAKKGNKLFGWVLQASPEPDAPFLVVVHGWGANAELMLPLAEPFYRAGVNVLLFDARNHGRSPSDGHSSMPKFAEDAGCAIDWLIKENERRAEPGSGSRKIALLGHSVGAAAALLTASRRDDIDAVISISSFAHPRWLMTRQLRRFYIPRPLIALMLRYVQLVIGHRFDDIAPVSTLRRIKCPVLLVHGLADETIPVSCLEDIRRSNPEREPKIMLIPDAGHASVDKIRSHGDELVLFLKQAGF
ncbi:MAG: alpha/beta fold hydrolase [Alphaproteobacteria bacterium]